MPEQQTFTAQQKLNALYTTGVYPLRIPETKYNTDGFPQGISSCCGVVSLTNRGYSRSKQETIDLYKKKIYSTITQPDAPIEVPLLSCAVVIPDALGNLLLEWEDV